MGVRSRIWGYATSTTRRAWTPRRRDGKRPIAPRPHGTVDEIAEVFDAYTVEIEQRFQQQLRELDNHGRHALTNLLEESASLASRNKGVNKEIIALTHRLAGLEDEAADLAASVQTIDARTSLSSLGISLRAGDRISVGEDQLMIVATASGTNFLLRRDDPIARLIAEGGEWQAHVRAAIESAARPDGVAVDVGADTGVHTVTMSRCFRSVHAFEPRQDIFQIFCGNLALNGIANVAAHNSAVDEGAVGDNQHSSTHNAVQAVRAVPLDDWALDDVALIKVGTRGADLRVLRGAETTIRRCRPIVLFECEQHPARQNGAEFDDVQSFFAALDYEVQILEEASTGRLADYIARPR